MVVRTIQREMFYLIALLLLLSFAWFSAGQDICTCIKIDASFCTRYELGDQISATEFECVETDPTECYSYTCTFPEQGGSGAVCPTQEIGNINPVQGGRSGGDDEFTEVCEIRNKVVAIFDSPIWINEFHYMSRNLGANVQYLEIGGLDRTILGGVFVVYLYDGNTQRVYNTVPLFGTLRSTGIEGVDNSSVGIITPSITGTVIRTGWGQFAFGASGTDNDGPANAIALVNVLKNPPEVSQFISYKGRDGTEFGGDADAIALDGPAGGLVPTPIGTFETPFTNDDHSLQLEGTGNEVFDFTWKQQPVQQTIDEANVGQTFL